MEMDTQANRPRREPAPQNSATSAAEISRIATDVESFLEMWVGRLEQLLGQFAHGSADEQSLQQRMAEFELARRRWNEERCRDVQQIQETTEQLSAAWERLEEEQRRVLESQQGLAPHRSASPRPTIDRPFVPVRPAPAAAPVPAAAPAPAVAREPAAAPEPVALPRAPHASPAEAAPSDAAQSNAAAAAARDRAVRQFQKLRRQVGMLPS